jgi:hypothetical protein
VLKFTVCEYTMWFAENFKYIQNHCDNMAVGAF